MSNAAGGGDSESDVTEPEVEYRDDPSSPDQYVLIRLDIPKLKKKMMSDKAANATIDLKPTEWSFSLTVTLTDSNAKVYRYAVQKLPYEIDTNPKKTKYKVSKNEKIELMLHKATPRSWARELSSVGLEHADQD
ncbi:unnamed protein product [Owenia fusiformis]|uniref:CS domain-containing protein n=1 Tax=Owenia fusiformis TaxID=6347 RepID=A0A8S4N4N6_OWEFU|nr:unnamed protein product [Owenia fusiformis]